jgi:hypothetical protein
LFSEAMRDLDLVVSVAHRGGVDPGASASTVEMRATVVQQTAQLLKLKNVRLKDRYALIKGEMGEYSVHPGSAVTRKMPGEPCFWCPCIASTADACFPRLPMTTQRLPK